MIFLLVLLLMRIAIGRGLLKNPSRHSDFIGYPRELSSTCRVGGTTNRAAITMVSRTFVGPGGNNKRKFTTVPKYDVNAFSAPGDLFTMQFDGGSRGNPGVAGSGAVIYAPSGDEVWWGYNYVGSTNTNNQAEYDGLILGLQQAQALNIDNLKIEGDSLLVISQLRGEWKVKNEGLKKYHKEASALARNIKAWSASHIPRDANARADKLSNDAMDSRGRLSTVNTALWPERRDTDTETAAEEEERATKEARVDCIEIDLSGEGENWVGGATRDKGAAGAPVTVFMEGTQGLLSVVTLVESNKATTEVATTPGTNMGGNLFFLLAKSRTDKLDAPILLELPAIPRSCASPFECVEECFTSDTDATEYSNTSSDLASHTAAGTLRMCCPSTWTALEQARQHTAYTWFSEAGTQDPTRAMASLAQAIYGTDIFTGRQVELLLVPASDLGKYVQHCQRAYGWSVSTGLEALAASTRLGLGSL